MGNPSSLQPEGALTGPLWYGGVSAFGLGIMELFRNILNLMAEGTENIQQLRIELDILTLLNDPHGLVIGKRGLIDSLADQGIVHIGRAMIRPGRGISCPLRP